jgi:hypothetical protein
MTGFIEDTALKFMGLDDADIQQINARLPDIQNLITVALAHQTQLNRVMTLLPIVQKIIAKQQELGK